MRIELVIDAPDITVASCDVIRLGNEVARLVRNDTGTHAELIHAAIGATDDIVVPRDYDEEHSILSGDAVVEDPNHAYTDLTSPRHFEEETPVTVVAEEDDEEAFEFTPIEDDEDEEVEDDGEEDEPEAE